MISPGTGNGQPSSSTLSTSITGSAAQPPLSRSKCHIDARERRADEALLGVGIVEPAHLERDEPLLAEVDRLLQRARLEIPEVDAGCP